MDTLLKWVAIILFAPLLVCVAAQAVVVALTSIFPYVLFLAVTIGAVAGLTAGMVLKHRLPSRDTHDREFPIPPPEPVRRPRGPRRRED